MKSHQTKSLTRTQSPGKCGKNGEKESDLKEQNNRLPKVYKWSFQMCKYFLENTPCGIVQKGFLNVLYFGFLVSVLILLQLVTNPHLKQKGVFWWFFFFSIFCNCSTGNCLSHSFRTVFRSGSWAALLFLLCHAYLSFWHEHYLLCVLLLLIFLCCFIPHYLVLVQTLSDWFAIFPHTFFALVNQHMFAIYTINNFHSVGFSQTTGPASGEQGGKDPAFAYLKNRSVAY